MRNYAKHNVAAIGINRIPVNPIDASPAKRMHFCTPVMKGLTTCYLLVNKLLKRHIVTSNIISFTSSLPVRGYTEDCYAHSYNVRSEIRK
jgi:hypothetical protein